MNRRLFGLIVASAVALGSMAQTAIARTLEDIIASGVLRVGTYADQPPMASLNNAGEYEGFDIEVANHIAGIMQVKVEIVPLTTAQRGSSATKTGRPVASAPRWNAWAASSPEELPA